MERRNKEKVTFECHGTKHESNRIAFSLMSYGLESSRAFIPQTFARCWWQLGECWVPWVVIDERKRERHKDRISSSQKYIYVFLEPTRHKETAVTPSFFRHRNAFPDCACALPSCASLTICICVH